MWLAGGSRCERNPGHMPKLTQSDQSDLARYPVSLQQTIAALWDVEPAERASSQPNAEKAIHQHHKDRFGSGNFKHV